MKFIVDANVGKLGKWLRVAGFDTVFAGSSDDNRIIRTAMDEKRVLLTRDTQILNRRVVSSGRLKAVLVENDQVQAQLYQVINVLQLVAEIRPFSRCIECNCLLIPKAKEEVGELVPPYVFCTKMHYMQCPQCCRIYWRGTHWERMSNELEKITKDKCNSCNSQRIRHMKG